jgi:hypothetical protein
VRSFAPPAISRSGIDFNPVAEAKRIVEAYVRGEYGPGFIPDTYGLPWQDAFDKLYAVAKMAKARLELSTAINSEFGKTAQSLEADPVFKALVQNVHDTIIAIFIHPGAHSLPITDLVLIARLMNLIARVAADDASLDDPGAVQSALTSTLLLPTAIFPLRDDLPQPVGVGDLLVVKQNLKRYELGDIANIENILRGESRKKFTKHVLTTDTTVTTTTSKVTETINSLDVTERFELKNEVNNTVKEDLSVNAGVNVSAKYGGVEINANADVAYSLSKDQSTKAATYHAKDVTSRAATKVTEAIQRTETARTIERLVQGENHSFENTTPGSTNVSGVYQWLNKVYEAQVFNYGSRLMFDLTVPEPAAFILDAQTTHDQMEIVVAPEPLVVIINPGTGWFRPVQSTDLEPDGTLKPGFVSRPLTPADLELDGAFYYGNYVAKYGAVGVNAPPEPTTTVSKALTGNKDDHDHLAVADNLTIPQGYQADEIVVQGGFTLYEQEDGDEQLAVFVGKKKFVCRGVGTLKPATAFLPDPSQIVDEQGNIPVAVETQQARDFAITVDVTCKRTDAALDQWKLDTHGTLLNAYAKLWGDYRDKLAAQKIQKAQVQSLGHDPAQNRIIERTELKKACIALLSHTDIYAAGFGDIAANSTELAFPRPNIPPKPNPNIVGGDQAAFIRFFEQAFEWEHMMYLFYPYYWARTEKWYSSALLDNSDQLFAEFLKAGSARVVVPVRLQLEGDVRYFLMTGQIWGGGAMPGITDTDYLPITEEIKARDDAPGTETPQGDPWEVLLPTTLIKLRDDDTLPIWNKYEVAGREVWVGGRVVDGKWVPDYGKLDSGGNWSP